MFEIGVACSTRYVPVQQAQDAGAEIFGTSISTRRLVDLAGPNDVLQYLADPAGWLLVAKAIAALYGAEFVKEAGKEGWRNRAKYAKSLSTVLATPLGRLMSALGYGLSADAHAVLAIPVQGAVRNAGIQIRSNDLTEIAATIVLLAEHAAEIQSFLNDALAQRETVTMVFDANGDMSIRITPHADGTLSISWRQRENAPADPAGQYRAPVMSSHKREFGK